MLQPSDGVARARAVILLQPSDSGSCYIPTPRLCNNVSNSSWTKTPGPILSVYDYCKSVLGLSQAVAASDPEPS